MNHQRPGLLVSFLPFLVLMSFLAFNIYIYGDNATGGANQLALFFAGALTIFIGCVFYKQKYKDI